MRSIAEAFAPLFCVLLACSTSPGDPSLDGGSPRDAQVDAPSSRVDADVEVDASEPPPSDAGVDAPAPEPCVTRITYGNAWIRGGDHPASHDDASGVVTWDGVCVDEGANSYATLSNGWRPYFRGHGACVIAFDARGACEPAPAPSCRTRITYGDAWIHGDGHPASYDDVNGVVTWEGTCRASSGGRSFARLSNGWEPHFTGSDACGLSFRYESCGGLFANPVIALDCPDPGVTFDGTRYVLTCTGGDAGGIYRIFTSTDLVTWTREGAVFPDGAPSWAESHFWAPEIHPVADGLYVAYYSAKNRADGSLAVGAATAPSATGPFTDLGRPLVHDPSPGVIDAHYFRASDGRRFLTWKVDGNAIGRPTPIRIQELAEDGVTLRGSARTILTNDRGWEGALVEGQWMVERDGFFYLFYSANGYASASYAVGVARATSPTGPFTKAGDPILVTNGAWGGPGHGSIVTGPRGETVHVYHAWERDRIGMSPGRQVLVDRVTWRDGWPAMLGAPSRRSQPMP
ncbi:MAG: family 43 glycosylhydrolase [Sandaracinus sp.]|nr:family 43 glycosylhydrolase [Sandaracinus sp.]MCB9635835.1 family 43 glycosylhydrolase [Sandaracinus sp.]